jgi:acyl-coenzyme A thioesterase PaaI-like protein
VATILDTAMGGAYWTLLEKGDTFLTGNLRVEYYR